MIRFIINAISQNLAFSKNEARGTFILAILVIITITSSRFITDKIKEQKVEVFNPQPLSLWVKEVGASYAEKTPEKPVMRSWPTPQYSIKKETTSPKKIEKTSREINERPEVISRMYDLNTATAENLQQVKGIGKVYSERIVKFRESLGGFASFDQLVEVYGITNELASKMRKNFNIQTSNRHLQINTDSVKLLMRHPYISYDHAWIIINYRKQNGDIDGFDDLKEIKALNDSILEKLRPYIK